MNIFLTWNVVLLLRACVCVYVCVCRLHMPGHMHRVRDVCRSNRLYNEMNACAACWRKILNERKLPVLSSTKERPVCSRPMKERIHRRGRTRPLAILGSDTKQAYSDSIECSWHRFIEYQFNGQNQHSFAIGPEPNFLTEKSTTSENKIKCKFFFAKIFNKLTNPFLIWINIKLTYNLLCIFILLKYL